jgi:hypothetical protein
VADVLQQRHLLATWCEYLWMHLASWALKGLASLLEFQAPYICLSCYEGVSLLETHSCVDFGMPSSIVALICDDGESRRGYPLTGNSTMIRMQCSSAVWDVVQCLCWQSPGFQAAVR